MCYYPSNLFGTGRSLVEHTQERYGPKPEDRTESDHIPETMIF